MGRALRPGEDVQWNTPHGAKHGPLMKKKAAKAGPGHAGASGKAAKPAKRGAPKKPHH